ncbi:KHG/KDPG aldolase [Peptococcaceae bacterium CEB3]|nr:KHG/KDPG aldolase [Peptococcaceae bacterium CEB3]
MLSKEDILARIIRGGLIAIVRTSDPILARQTVQAIAAGGAEVIEVSFVVPAAAGLLRDLAEEYKERNVLIGAGTVLDSETARAAVLAGAQFVVCPALEPDTVRLCQRYGIPCVPGAMSPGEIQQALTLGADLIKFFPASAFQPHIAKDLRAPFPQARLVPTGGVTLENVGDWIRFGATAVGVGGEITAPANEGRFSEVTALTDAFLQKIREARQGR